MIDTNASGESETKDNSGVRQMFQSHHDEIARRRTVEEEVGRGGGFSSFAPSKNDCERLPFCLPEQAFVLYSISHKEMAPVCKDIYDPSIRIYGCFNDADAALEYAHGTGLAQSGVSLQIHPLREWAIASSTPERLQNSKEKLEEILEFYRTQRVVTRAEFEENVRDKKMGETYVDAEKEDTIKPGLFEHKCTLREKKKTAAFFHSPPPNAQAVAVVSFLPDPCSSAANGAEFAFQVFGALETLEQADKWVRETLADKVPDIDIDIVQAGTWLFPQNASKKIAKTVYRQDELNKIMTNHAQQPSKVAAFEEWKAQENPSEPFKP